MIRIVQCLQGLAKIALFFVACGPIAGQAANDSNDLLESGLEPDAATVPAQSYQSADAPASDSSDPEKQDATQPSTADSAAATGDSQRLDRGLHDEAAAISALRQEWEQQFTEFNQRVWAQQKQTEQSIAQLQAQQAGLQERLQALSQALDLINQSLAAVQADQELRHRPPQARLSTLISAALAQAERYKLWSYLAFGLLALLVTLLGKNRAHQTQSDQTVAEK